MFRWEINLLLMFTAALSAVAASQDGTAPGATPAKPPEKNMQPAAGAAEHVWVLLPAAGAEGGVELLHHAVSMVGSGGSGDGGVFGGGESEPGSESALPGAGVPGARVAISLPESPTHLAAFGARLWLAFPPTAMAKGNERIRPVYTVRAVENPATGLYFNDPSRRLELLAALPGDGRLVDLAATSRGPIALIAPASWRAAGVEAGEESIAAEDGLKQPRLLELRAAGWMDLAYPAELDALEPIALGVGAGDAPVIFATDRRPRQREVYLFRRGPDETWSRMTLNLPAALIGTARVQDQLYLLLFDAESARLTVCLVREGDAWPVAEVTVRERTWAAAALGSGIALVERAVGAEAKPTLRVIDPIQGTATAATAFQPQAVEGATRLYLPFALGLIMTVILLIFVLRPVPAEPEAQVAPHVLPLDLPLRAAALAIDALPGVVVAMIVIPIPPEELWHLIWWAVTLVHTEAVATCAAVTVVHGAIGEMIWGKSLGKKIVGGRVVTLDGARPGAGAVVMRNCLKFITMVIPALGVFVLVNNTRQGMGELWTKTIVAGQAPPTVKPKSEDGSAEE